MTDPKKNIIVFCEDEKPIYDAYLSISRQLGLKTPFCPTKPESIAGASIEDGQVFLFNTYKDAHDGLDALAKRHDCRVVLLVMDQVLDPRAKNYLSHGGHFGSALIERHSKGLREDKTAVALRTAEEGDILHVLEELGAKVNLEYLLKRVDPDYKRLIKFMLPHVARATGTNMDELNKRADLIAFTDHPIPPFTA